MRDRQRGTTTKCLIYQRYSLHWQQSNIHQKLCTNYTTFTLQKWPNHAEPNRTGSAVQTMLAWFGPAHFSSVLWLFTLSTNWADRCWPTKMCQCKRSIRQFCSRISYNTGKSSVTHVSTHSLQVINFLMDNIATQQVQGSVFAFYSLFWECLYKFLSYCLEFISPLVSSQNSSLVLARWINSTSKSKKPITKIFYHNICIQVILPFLYNILGNFCIAIFSNSWKIISQNFRRHGTLLI